MQRKNSPLRTATATHLRRESFLSAAAGTFCLDNKNWIESVPNAEDMKRITDEIKEARKQADVVFVSFHGHECDEEDTTVPARFLGTFSRACIDAALTLY